MSLNFKITPQASYIRCELTGVYDDNQEIIDNFTQLFAVCRKHNCSKILYDHRSISNLPSSSAVDRILTLNKIIDNNAIFVSLGGAALRLATLAAEEKIPSYQPALATAQDRGFAAMITSDEDQAIAWLLGSETAADE